MRTEKLTHALRLLACVTVAAASLALLGWWAEANTTLLIERALLMTAQLPSRTRIEKIDCPVKIAAGDDLKIDVQAGGVIPEQGLIIAQSGSRKSEYKLERDPAGGGLFHAVIQSVPESLIFTVRLNDATSDPVSVAVYSPPVVVGVATVEEYPAYTGLPRPSRRQATCRCWRGACCK